MTTYKVTTKTTVPNLQGDAIPTLAVRLVEAKTKAQAIAHVVSDTIEAGVCSISEAVELGAAGVKVEKVAP